MNKVQLKRLIKSRIKLEIKELEPNFGLIGDVMLIEVKEEDKKKLFEFLDKRGTVYEKEDENKYWVYLDV